MLYNEYEARFEIMKHYPERKYIRCFKNKQKQSKYDVSQVLCANVCVCGVQADDNGDKTYSTNPREENKH